MATGARALWALFLLAPVAGAHGGTPASVKAIVLGVAQDGGVPHVGCARACCESARRNPLRAHRVASLGLVVVAPDGTRSVFLIDATPDFRSQLDDALGEGGAAGRPAGLPLDGILLTHAHVGHYAGLIYLGRESAGARGVPVFASARMGRFLAENGPWKRLVEAGNISLKELTPGVAQQLAPGLSVTPLRVPHREEDSDVMGYLVAGPQRRLLYIPDIDSWEKWETDIAQLVSSVDVALLDATFYSAAELPGRSLAEIPHPLVPASMDRLEDVARRGTRVLFIHLNHTNPALDPASAGRREILRRGFDVATDGMELPL